MFRIARSITQQLIYTEQTKEIRRIFFKNKKAPLLVSQFFLGKHNPFYVK